MLKSLAVAFALTVAACSVAHGQASTTASRRFDLQVGGGFVIANSDYIPNKIKGGAVYATLDFTNHFGAEFVIHQANSSANRGPEDDVYERTYELGGRYHRTYGRFKPYVKIMYGRGVFNFPNDEANLAYNLFSGGVGTDYELTRRFNLRLDYEYQTWPGFPPNGLTPQVLTIGVAYHFPGDLLRGRHY